MCCMMIAPAGASVSARSRSSPACSDEKSSCRPPPPASLITASRHSPSNLGQHAIAEHSARSTHPMPAFAIARVPTRSHRHASIPPCASDTSGARRGSDPAARSSSTRASLSSSPNGRASYVHPMFSLKLPNLELPQWQGRFSMMSSTSATHMRFDLCFGRRAARSAARLAQRATRGVSARAQSARRHAHVGRKRSDRPCSPSGAAPCALHAPLLSVPNR